MQSINRKPLFVFLLGIVMLLSLAACGTPAADAPAADAPAADAPAAGDMVESYTFTNTGSVDLCELYLSPTGQSDWGVDQLGENTIPVGEQFILHNIPAGTYDARAVGCDGAGEAIVSLDIHN